MFRRRVVDFPGFGNTAVAIGRAAREGRMVDIEGVPLFFRDLPNEGAQKVITKKLGHPQGRLFSEQEKAQILAASAINKQLNDTVLGQLQQLYDAQDPARMAGAALIGALAGGGLSWALKPASAAEPASAQP